MTPAPKAAYRPREFADALGVSERQVARWVASGEVRSVKRGRCRLIPAWELARVTGEHAEGVACRPVSPRAARLLKAVGA